MLKNQKGISLIVLVLIAVVVIVIGAVSIVLVINNSNNDNNTNSSQDVEINNNKTENNNSLETTKISWDEYEIVIDGTSLKFPMTYNEFISKGFYVQDIYEYNSDLPLDNYVLKAKSSKKSFAANYAVFTNGTTNNINIEVYNPSEESKKVSECYVIGIEMEYKRGVLPQIKIGEFKIINHSRNSELIIGKSTISEISSSFGAHYESDYSNVFTYYPDSNNDGKITPLDITSKHSLSLHCDSNTQVLIPDEFQYRNYGNL